MEKNEWKRIEENVAGFYKNPKPSAWINHVSPKDVLELLKDAENVDTYSNELNSALNDNSSLYWKLEYSEGALKVAENSLIKIGSASVWQRIKWVFTGVR